MLGSAIFSTFSLIAACIVKSRERFMGIGQVLTMPLFFASNAIYPLSLMPTWLRTLVQIQSAHLSSGRAARPDGARRRASSDWAYDFGVLFLILALLIAVATKLYPRILL